MRHLWNQKVRGTLLCFINIHSLYSIYIHLWRTVHYLGVTRHEAGPLELKWSWWLQRVPGVKSPHPNTRTDVHPHTPDLTTASKGDLEATALVKGCYCFASVYFIIITFFLSISSPSSVHCGVFSSIQKADPQSTTHFKSTNNARKKASFTSSSCL